MVGGNSHLAYDHSTTILKATAIENYIALSSQWPHRVPCSAFPLAHSAWRRALQFGLSRLRVYFLYAWGLLITKFIHTFKNTCIQNSLSPE